MAWGNRQAFDTINGTPATLGNETALQISAADAKVALAPNEQAHFEIKVDTGGTTDHLIVTIYASNADSPGAVPDNTQTLAGSDWSIYTQFRVVADKDNEWQYANIRGVRRFAVSVVMTGTTDSVTVNAGYSIGTP